MSQEGQPMSEEGMTFEEKRLARRLVKDTPQASKDYASKFGLIAPAPKDYRPQVRPEKPKPKPIDIEAKKAQQEAEKARLKAEAMKAEHAKFFVKGKKKDKEKARRMSDAVATRDEVRKVLKEQQSGGTGIRLGSLLDQVIKDGTKPV